MAGIRAVVASGATAQGNQVGAEVLLRAGQLSDLIVTQLQGDKYEQTYRGNRYSVCNQAAVSTTAGTATTFTGLVIGNPSGSGYNLVIDKMHCAQLAAGVAGSVGFMIGTSTTAITSTLTVLNRKIGGVAGVGVASAGQTIGTPTVMTSLASLGSLATTGYSLSSGFEIDLHGGVIVPPGYFIASYTSAATTSALQFTFVWTEVPI